MADNSAEKHSAEKPTRRVKPPKRRVKPKKVLVRASDLDDPDAMDEFVAAVLDEDE